MVYLLGVNLPDNRIVPISLTRIYGIGLYTATRLCNKLLIHPSCKLSDLPEDKITQLSALLNTMKIESELKRQVENNVSKMIAIGTYRGHRHKIGLPVKGQKTKSNAQTAKRLNGMFLKYASRSYSTHACNRSFSSYSKCATWSIKSLFRIIK